MNLQCLISIYILPKLPWHNCLICKSIVISVGFRQPVIQEQFKTQKIRITSWSNFCIFSGCRRKPNLSEPDLDERNNCLGSCIRGTEVYCSGLLSFPSWDDDSFTHCIYSSSLPTFFKETRRFIGFIFIFI